MPESNQQQAPPPVETADSLLARDLTDSDTSDSADKPQAAEWTASEFIAHDKSFGWYLKLAGVSLVIAGLIFLLTRDKVTTVLVPFLAILFAVMASRKPRQLPYRVDAAGVQIGNRHFDYGNFKSFSVLDEGAFSSIVFMPLKRFSPLITIYYAPKDEPTIVAILTERLPFQEHKLDPIDRLMQRIRF